MNPRIYTYELYEHDCVGNDLAKHNFNFLNLESKICNIYTDYFDDASSYVRQVSAFMDKLKELKKLSKKTNEVLELFVSKGLEKAMTCFN